ncbi:hypothetical protein GCM10009067_14590 [Haloarcula sebkhae]|uniref:Uncharacterized protein n=1 Tax=Haloarcula sebkhae TaxID=932660 RepID=A0A830EW68_9EURY|nr:hypothetical protein GCM10009067_14590 [Haloarcula sebkhae]
MLGGDQGVSETLRIDPSHELGLLAEIITLVYLLFGSTLLAVSVWASFRQRPVIPTVVLVWLAAVKVSFVADVYSISSNTQFVVALGLGLSAIPPLLTWVTAEVYRITAAEAAT